jgi:hypothetical protein
MPKDDSVPDDLCELGWALYRHTLSWLKANMGEDYTAREALTVLGIAFGSVSFLLLDRSKDKVAGHTHAWTGDGSDVKVKAPMSQLIRQHRDRWPKSLHGLHDRWSPRPEDSPDSTW